MKVIAIIRVASLLIFGTVFKVKLSTKETFKHKTFVEEPTLHAINLLKKSQLLEVNSYYKVKVNSSQKKSKITQVFIDYLIDEKMIPEDVISNVNPQILS